ncbi:MAG: hypothetical protein AB1461_13445 [Thermodesulfobacteriota bacterium]
MEVIDFDFRFVELYQELYALEEYMESIESQLPDLIQKEEKKAYESLREKGYEDDPIERQQIQQRLHELIEEVLPKYFLGAILVTLWAIFESAILEIAKEVKDQQKQKVILSDIDGDFLKRTNKYFNHILKIHIDTGDRSWQHLRMFYVLRNALAHANGRLDNIKKDKDKDEIKKWAKEDIGIKIINGSLLFNQEFARETYSIVFQVIKNLTDQVTAKYPKPINW